MKVERFQHIHTRTMAAEDLASTLAREVVAYTKLRDRPSKLALVVASANAPDRKFTVTAPIVNGRQLLRVTWPGATDIADYDRNNCEGVAIIIESGLHSNTILHLCAISNSGDLARPPITSWASLHTMKTHQDRLDIILKILKTLFTIDAPVSTP